MAFQIQLRRGTASAWSTVNPTLVEGEAGLESDTNKMKIGDGTTAWNSLDYFPNIDSGLIATSLGYTPASTGKSIAMAIVFGG